MLIDSLARSLPLAANNLSLSSLFPLYHLILSLSNFFYSCPLSLFISSLFSGHKTTNFTRLTFLTDLTYLFVAIHPISTAYLSRPLFFSTTFFLPSSSPIFFRFFCPLPMALIFSKHRNTLSLSFSCTEYHFLCVNFIPFFFFLPSFCLHDLYFIIFTWGFVWNFRSAFSTLL